VVPEWSGTTINLLNKGTNIMGIDFTKTFGRNMGITQSNAQELPKAKVWINIGYLTEDPEYPFVSLPVGIPLDTQEALSTNSRNEKFSQFTAARNGLLGQLKNWAETLKPGEDTIVELEGGLAIQFRRVQDAAPEPDPANSPFLRDFGLSAAE
jgi:hypothetical protein